MLKITFIEFILRGLPEAFLFIFAAYIFSNTKIELKKYLGISMLMGVIAYCIRLLPINYGVHTILSLFAFIILCVSILKIDYIKSIKTAVIIFIMQFLCEGINIAIIERIFNVSLDVVISDPIKKVIYTTPSTIIFLCILVGVYFYKKRKFKAC